MGTEKSVAELTALASNAKRKIKEKGKFAITLLSVDEILAMAFICDLFLRDDPQPEIPEAQITQTNEN